MSAVDDVFVLSPGLPSMLQQPRAEHEETCRQIETTAQSPAGSVGSGIGSRGSPLNPASAEEIDPIKAWESLGTAPNEHYFENGRRYHMFKRGLYPIPNDEDEQSREDMKHAMMLDLTGGKLFYAPIGDTPQKVLDIGTGTGIWAIDVADRYPGAEVLGTDLSAMQPDLVPPNVRFMVDDVEEDEWLNGSDWDLIHLRMVSGCLRDLQGTIDKCFEHTRPGGWIEFQDLHVSPQCDDETMQPGDVLKNFYELVFRSFEALGMDHDRPRLMRRHLQQAGFVNIGCVIKKTPIGPWARGHHMQRIGECMRFAIIDLLPSFVRPLEAILVSRVEAEVWFLKVRRALDDLSVHRYVNHYFWYGQKPE